jgi:hypothetical protein
MMSSASAGLFFIVQFEFMGFSTRLTRVLNAVYLGDGAPRSPKINSGSVGERAREDGKTRLFKGSFEDI